MKQLVIWVLFLCAGFSLSAQTPGKELSVYVPPVGGRAGEPEDNSFFAGRLALELMGRNYSLAGNPASAGYILKGTLASLSGNTSPRSARAFSFHLLLSESVSGRDLAEQTLIYSAREELDSLLPVMVSNMFSGLPGIPSGGDNWRGKLLYFGAAAYWTPRLYYGNSRSLNMANFGAGVSAEFQFLNFLALEAGAEAAPEWVTVSDRSGDGYRDIVLEIPLSLKLVLKPGVNFMIEPYGGVHFNLSLYGAAKPPPFSWRAGLQYGIKAGPGVFFVEPRFSMDLGNAALEAKSGKTIEYRRYVVYIGAGYKFGVKNRS